MPVILRVSAAGDTHSFLYEGMPDYNRVVASLLTLQAHGIEPGSHMAQYRDEEGDLCVLSSPTFDDFKVTACQEVDGHLVLNVELPASIMTGVPALKVQKDCDTHRRDSQSQEENVVGLQACADAKQETAMAAQSHPDGGELAMLKDRLREAEDGKRSAVQALEATKREMAKLEIALADTNAAYRAATLRAFQSDGFRNELRTAVTRAAEAERAWSAQVHSAELRAINAERVAETQRYREAELEKQLREVLRDSNQIAGTAKVAEGLEKHAVLVFE